jgi:hypothetical protein
MRPSKEHCAVASRCARSFPSEAVRAVSRHLAASHRYCSAVLLMLLSRGIRTMRAFGASRHEVVSWSFERLPS